jgi:hypothetical protein
VLILLPLFGERFGVDLNFLSQIITRSARAIIDVILRLTGNGQ